jgi:cob(I)alamin adenosyltransferase
MGKRLSKIYTRTGDQGETGLGDGNRVIKDAARVEAMGAVDEFNSALGVLIEELLEELRNDEQQELAAVLDFLNYCQHRTFDLGGEISIPGFSIINTSHVDLIEQKLDALNDNLPPLENFILPAGSRLIAAFHMARSICRRAERRLVSLSRDEDINAAGLQFLNRMSDYLFVAARHCAKVQGVDEVLWQKDKD